MKPARQLKTQRGGAEKKQASLSPASSRQIREREREARRQAETASGPSHHAPWSDKEDFWMMKQLGMMTKAQIALKLGRSYYAVNNRIIALKREEKTVGTRLKEHLAEHKIGLRAFAREMGTSAAAMSDIINHAKFTQRDFNRGIKNRIREALFQKGVSDPKLFDRSKAEAKRDELINGLEEEDKWRAEMLDQSALDFYGLKQDPFDLNAVRAKEDIYWTASHKEMKAALERAITRRDFIAISGEVGTGKSLIRKAVIEGLDGRHRVISPAVLEKETLTPFHLQEAIIEDLKAGQPDYTKPTRASKESRERQVLELLKLYYSEGITCVLVIEEAHALPLRLLKTLKRLYEIQAGFEPILGIVLVGQEELKKFWQDIRVREFNRRCRLKELPALRASEIPGYIKHKFARAQENADTVFAEDALKAVADRLKHGSPALQVNNLCARAVNRATEARVKKITGEFIMSLD